MLTAMLHIHMAVFTHLRLHCSSWEAFKRIAANCVQLSDCARLLRMAKYPFNHRMYLLRTIVALAPQCKDAC